MNTLSKYASLVRFAHTVFAMPFALIGFVYGLTRPGAFSTPSSAVDPTLPPTSSASLPAASSNISDAWYVTLLLVVLCMVFARNAAMGFNRWADRAIDAANPRTAGRDIPAGRIAPRKALWFVAANGALFIIAAALINPLAGWLSPVALTVVLFYSYCKRFTALSHLVLGLSLGIAPVGAYIAATGRFALEPCILALLVMTWCAGFDIIYALQDAAFDRARGLHSVPARFSARTALAISCALHAVSVAALLWFATYCNGSAWLWAGVGIFTAMLVLQHLLVTPTRQRHVGIAFGTLNGLASVALAAGVIVDLLK